MVGEDVEDDGGAVDHRYPQRGLQVALLARRQLVVAGDQVGVASDDLLLQLRELAATEVAVGVGRRPLLHRLARRSHPGGAQQLLQLGEGIAGLAAVDDADRHRPLARPRIRNAASPAPWRVCVLRPFLERCTRPDCRRRPPPG